METSKKMDFIEELTSFLDNPSYINGIGEEKVRYVQMSSSLCIMDIKGDAIDYLKDILQREYGAIGGM